MFKFIAVTAKLIGHLAPGMRRGVCPFSQAVAISEPLHTTLLNPMLCSPLDDVISQPDSRSSVASSALAVCSFVAAVIHYAVCCCGSALKGAQFN